MRLSIEELREIAGGFRRQIELIPKFSRLEQMVDFPNGACGDASLMLGTYLIDLGEEPFDYVLGVRGAEEPGKQRQSHA